MMQIRILCVLLSFVVASFGNDLSNPVRRSLGFPNSFGSQFGSGCGGGSGGDGGFYAGMFAGQGGGFGGFGGMGGGNNFGRNNGGQGGYRVTVNVACNPQTPYVDECQQQCYCQNNCIICPVTTKTEINMQVSSSSNPCEGNNGGSFQKGCNICMCTDVGQICSSYQC